MSIKGFDLDKMLTVREVLAALEDAGAYDTATDVTHEVDAGDLGMHRIECDAGFDVQAFEIALAQAIDSREARAA